MKANRQRAGNCNKKPTCRPRLSGASDKAVPKWPIPATKEPCESGLTQREDTPEKGRARPTSDARTDAEQATATRRGVYADAGGGTEADGGGSD